MEGFLLFIQRFWDKLDHLNKIPKEANERGMGLGECAGYFLHDNLCVDGERVCGDYVDFSDIYQFSIAANAWRADVPMTVHVSIGTDILSMYPKYDGGEWGRASYRDFMILVDQVTRINGGVFINAGSAVAGPEVFLKSFSVAANVGCLPERLTTAVMDIQPLPLDWKKCEWTRNHREYYWRPWKTILKRTVTGHCSGESLYIEGDMKDTIPHLWTLLTS